MLGLAMVVSLEACMLSAAQSGQILPCNFECVAWALEGARVALGKVGKKRERHVCF